MHGRESTRLGCLPSRASAGSWSQNQDQTPTEPLGRALEVLGPLTDGTDAHGLTVSPGCYTVRPFQLLGISGHGVSFCFFLCLCHIVTQSGGPWWDLGVVHSGPFSHQNHQPKVFASYALVVSTDGLRQGLCYVVRRK